MYKLLKRLLQFYHQISESQLLRYSVVPSLPLLQQIVDPCTKSFCRPFTKLPIKIQPETGIPYTISIGNLQWLKLQNDLIHHLI